MLFSLPATLHTLITSLLWSSSTHRWRPTDGVLESSPLTFQLRHQHATTTTSRIIFADVPLTSNFARDATFVVDTKRSRIPRPPSHAAFNAARRMQAESHMSAALDWRDTDVDIPDVTKRSTLLSMAKMTFNAYYADNSSDWYNVDEDGWDKHFPHGWLPTDDGMRGHVFVSTDNSTVVIVIKGTSALWPVGDGGPTTAKDKRNDNLLFSCCCARVGPTWSTVCGCYDGGYKCNDQCVQDALAADEGLFYPIGLNLYNNVSFMYPNADIWVTGHSLGGSLSSLIGVTFGLPVVAFESPAEKMAARRLHLPPPPSMQHITHVYHTADPIPMGVCTGLTSVCSLGGFALESRCHLGQVIRYDTVGKLGWSVNAQNHPIKVVIDKVLEMDLDWQDEQDKDKPLLGVTSWPWGGGGKKEDEGDEEGKKPEGFLEVPQARLAGEVEGVDGVCTDCFNWEFT